MFEWKKSKTMRASQRNANKPERLFYDLWDHFKKSNKNV